MVKWTFKGEAHPWKKKGFPDLGARVGGNACGRDEAHESRQFQLNFGRGHNIPGVSYGPRGEVLCANRRAAQELAKLNNDLNPHTVMTWDK